MKNFLTSEAGATTAEYAILLALIAGALLFSILAVGGEANVFWGNTGSELSNAFE
ncbi:MAG: Flp family type IVb pilin [Mariniblastus sp.]